MAQRGPAVDDHAFNLTRSRPESLDEGDRSTTTAASGRDLFCLDSLGRLLSQSPIPQPDIVRNLPLYLNRETLGDVLTAARLYESVLSVPGDVFEFGTRWGRRLALFMNLRELMEPHNYTRRIVGFDTFAGFPSVSPEDGDMPLL
jgi:hypothetical protein